MRVRRGIGICLAIALMATGCGFVGYGDEVPAETPAAPTLVDHATASSPPRRPAPADPASGDYTKTWRTDVPGTFDEPDWTQFAFTPGQLLVFSEHDVVARATDDGAARWHYRVRDGEVDGYALTSGVVVLTLATPDPRAIGLDAETGGVLWQSTAYVSPTPTGIGVHAASGGIVVLQDVTRGSVLFGVDARTGARRWSWNPGADRPCVTSSERSDGELLLFTVGCGKTETLYAVAPTGRKLWRWTLPSADFAESESGVTLAGRESTGLRLIGRNGRELHRMPTSDPWASALTVVDGRAVIRYASPAGARLTSVDLRTGEASAPVATELVGELATAAGRVYGQRAPSGEDSPTTMLAVDPRTTHTTARASLPLGPRSDPGEGAWGGWGRQNLDTEWFLLDGGRAYTIAFIDDRLRITAYAPG